MTIIGKVIGGRPRSLLPPGIKVFLMPDLRECLFVYAEYPQRDSSEPIGFVSTVAVLGTFCKAICLLFSWGILLVGENKEYQDRLEFFFVQLDNNGMQRCRDNNRSILI